MRAIDPRFGGHWAAADVFVCVVDRVDAAARHELERYGAQVRIVPRYTSRNGSSNKLRLLLRARVYR